jgi:hypothetical protein
VQLINNNPKTTDPRVGHLLGLEELCLYNSTTKPAKLCGSMLSALISSAGFDVEQEVYISNMLGLVAGNVSMVARIKLQALPYGESRSVTISHHNVVHVCQQVRVQEQKSSQAPDRHHHHWQSKHEKAPQPPRAWVASQPMHKASMGLLPCPIVRPPVAERDWVSCEHSCDKAIVCPVAMYP